MLINQTPHFEIERLYAHNSLRNYTYVLIERATRRGWVIDPWDGEAVVEWAKGSNVKLSGILNTHQHHDHIKGNEALQIQGVPVLKTLKMIEAWPAPGHTMEHQVFWLQDGEETHLFAGDTIFQAGVGNCKNGGEPGVLFHTLEELRHKLLPTTYLHPGHDYLERNLEFALQVDPENMAAQKLLAEIKGTKTYERPAHQWKTELAINPFLRLRQLSKPLASRSEDDEIIFKELRQLRDTW